MNDIEYKTITLEGREVRCYPDGSTKTFDIRTGKWTRSVGSNATGGYKCRAINRKSRPVHRLIAQAWLSDWNPDLQVDHINGDKSDNRVTNLRMLTNQANCQGFQSKPKGCTSKYRGVSWFLRDKLWVAQCRIDGKGNHIGRYKDEEDAARAYDEFALANGFQAEALNFPTNTNTK